MQSISVQTTQNVTIHHTVASIGDRILAYLLDRILLIVYIIGVITLFIQLNIDAWWVYAFVLGIPLLFYHLAFEIFMNGKSPGKQVMNIQVIRLDGTAPTIGDYVLRWLFSIIDFYILSGAVAVVIIASNGKGQRLGDIVAGTSVVKLTAQRQITAEEVFIAPSSEHQPVYPQAIQLESYELELIQRALEANKEHGNMKPALLVAEKIKAMLGITTDVPAVEFLYTIVKDHHELSSR